MTDWTKGASTIVATLTITILVIVAGCQPALGRPDREAQVDKAEAYWSHHVDYVPPCDITITYHNLPGRTMGEAWLGGMPDCNILLDKAYIRHVARHYHHAYWRVQCDTILHEAGHVYGENHHGKGLMAAEYEGDLHSYCAR